MLKKLVFVISALIAVLPAVAKPAVGPNYTYTIQPINYFRNGPIEVVSATSDKNVAVSYVPGMLEFQLIDKSGTGAPGKSVITIKSFAKHYPGTCKLTIISSGAGAIWTDPGDCSDLCTDANWKLKGENFYSFNVYTYDGISCNDN